MAKIKVGVYIPTLIRLVLYFIPLLFNEAITIMTRQTVSCRMTPDFLGVVIANAELGAWLILNVVIICLECHNITYTSRIGCIQHVIRSSSREGKAMCAIVFWCYSKLLHLAEIMTSGCRCSTHKTIGVLQLHTIMIFMLPAVSIYVTSFLAHSYSAGLYDRVVESIVSGEDISPPHKTAYFRSAFKTLHYEVYFLSKWTTTCCENHTALCNKHNNIKTDKPYSTT